MDELTERQQLILRLVVREYIRSAAPVSSKALVEGYGLNISSATVRNEFAVLEAQGFLRQPHTSAGRVPTEKGYRFFVQRLLGDIELPAEERRMILHQFHQVYLDLDQWMQLAAAVLAHTVRSASLITPPHVARSRFKHVELIATHGRMVLLVLVLQGGEVREQMLTLDEPVDQSTLRLTADYLNEICADRTASEIEARLGPLPALEHDVARAVVAMMRQVDARTISLVYHDGLTHILSEPEFRHSEAARAALQLLEERNLLEDILNEALGPTVGGVKVLIGGEGRWEQLRACSIVLARYGISGYATGALGVLGPTRMAYGRAISAVRYVAGLLNDLVYEMYGG
ncbi:MAG: heat-inducible transcription repressor HrcA [Chloroflexota bacterium]